MGDDPVEWPDGVLGPEAYRQAKQEGRLGHITDFDVEEAVRNGTFRWAPPLIERSPRPKTLYLVWRSFQIVFDDIDDPATFPPIQDALAPGGITVCRRYIEAAEELSESELLCGSDRITISWNPEDGESVDATFTSKEITRGFAALLRQFDSNEERASFHAVNNFLRDASMATADSHGPRRCRHLHAWRSARGQLQGAEIQRLARRKLGMEYGNEHSSSYYLSAYNYGDLIHWDRKREVLKKWSADEVQKNLQRFAFVEAATSVALAYIGFSAIVRRATSLQ
jgi:hypothetical protein